MAGGISGASRTGYKKLFGRSDSERDRVVGRKFFWEIFLLLTWSWDGYFGDFKFAAYIFFSGDIRRKISPYERAPKWKRNDIGGSYSRSKFLDKITFKLSDKIRLQ